MRRLVFVLLAVALVPAATAAQKRGLLPADYYKEVTSGEAAVSPDGTLVAFTVTTIVEKDNKRHREIWMARVADRSPFRFTDPTYESSGPRWAPDGQTLAFTSRRGKDTNSIWFTRVTAPGGEAFRIEGVTGSPIWSPDGKWIAFT